MGHNVGFLQYGDSPKGAFPLRAWPEYSRLGGQIYEEPLPPGVVSGGGLVAGFRRPAKEDSLLGLRDEKDLTEILMMALGSEIIN